MSDLVNREKIQEFLKLPNLDKQLYALLAEYVKTDVNGCSNSLEWISHLAKQETYKLRKECCHTMSGLEQMIHFDGCELTGHHLVTSTIRAVMAYFPMAHPGGASELGKRFFKRFVIALRESHEVLIDSSWSTRVVECNDYLKLVLKNNPEGTL